MFNAVVNFYFISHRPFSDLNLSHASFKVLNTAPAIILCSVVASLGICNDSSVDVGIRLALRGTHFIWMAFPDASHVYYLDFVC